ncbi:hypothetical protein [Acrocarpospora sp. B8E8]|uniref:hypothetical protein n=1 Tax=Acrocarpospora sp. B8E8 TaxID=3153572 RepID=UPI00325C453F
MTLRSKLLTSIGVLCLLLHGALGVSALAEGGSGTSYPSHREPDGSIGIKLLEASSNRKNDPRAYLYIVDHINPGTRVSRRFEIKNTSSRSQRIKLYPGAAEIRHNTFVPAANRNANELGSWISIDRSELIAPPNSRIQLNAKISIPKSASEGERYGAIWAEVASPSVKPGSAGNIQLINRVGIRVYLDIGPGGDPPSDFRIEQLTPGRTEVGMPVVKATVNNTGERALDLGGQMWLSDGPGGLNAGPFRAQVGTTLAPGYSAPVMVMLDDRLPDGPWQVKLMLESGRVHHTVTGTLTFPEKPATWGLPALLDSFLPRALVIIGSLVAVALLVLAVRRSRRWRRMAQ